MNTMNPLLNEALGFIVRYILVAVAGGLVTRGIWTPERAEVYVAAAATSIMTFGWGLWVVYRRRLKIVTALQTDEKMSEEDLEAKMRKGMKAEVTTQKRNVPKRKVVKKVKKDDN